MNRLVFKCHKDHDHNNQDEVDKCNKIFLQILEMQKPFRCQLGHEHHNSMEVTECNTKGRRLLSSLPEIKLMRSERTEEGRKVLTSVTYRGDPEFLKFVAFRTSGANLALTPPQGSQKSIME